MTFSIGAVAVRDTIPATPPASNARHMIKEGGGRGGGTKSEPVIIVQFKECHSIKSANYLYQQIVQMPISQQQVGNQEMEVNKKNCRIQINQRSDHYPYQLDLEVTLLHDL